MALCFALVACKDKPPISVEVPPVASAALVVPRDAGAPPPAELPAVLNGVCDLADDFICSDEGHAMLQCEPTSMHYRLASGCNGARGCKMTNKKVVCDNSIASVGEACREEDDFACAPDRTQALICRSGHFVPASQCGGPKGCEVTGDERSGYKVECDDSVGVLGDTCAKDGHYSCTSDHKTIMKCRQGKFVVEERCKPRENCAIRAGQVGCY